MSRSKIRIRTVHVAVALLMLVAISPAWAADARSYWHFSGAFHPAVAHFPIALLVVAGIVELWRFLRGKKIPGDAGYTCLIFGSMGAVVAAVLGWANAEHAGSFNGAQAQVLETHRWLGVGVAVGSIIMAIVATRSRNGGSISGFKRFGYVAALLVCSALVGLTGSFGGKLTFGVDYYETVFNETIGAEESAITDPSLVTHEAMPLSQPVVSAFVESSPTAKVIGNPVEPSVAVAAVSPSIPVLNHETATTKHSGISYKAQIKPLLAASCIKCHGEGKAKADYRMDTRDHALTAGDSGEQPIVPGKADESLLVKVIEGKGEYKESMMPPKGSLFSPEQVALVRKWIDEGALWDE